MIDPQLIEILRCPFTASTLKEAEQDCIDSINQLIEKRQLQSKLMESLTLPIDGGLINEDGSLLMPVYQGIPDMNPDDAIPLEQLTKGTSDEWTNDI